MSANKDTLKTLRQNNSWYMYANIYSEDRDNMLPITIEDINYRITAIKNNETYKNHILRGNINPNSRQNAVLNLEPIPGYRRNLWCFVISACVGVLSEATAIISSASDAAINHRVAEQKNATAIEFATLRSDNARITEGISYGLIAAHTIALIGTIAAILFWASMTRSVQNYSQSKDDYEKLKDALEYLEQVKEELDLKEKVISNLAAFFGAEINEKFINTTATVIDSENNLTTYKLLKDKLSNKLISPSVNKAMLLFLYSSLCLKYLDRNADSFTDLKLSQYRTSLEFFEAIENKNFNLGINNIHPHDFLITQVINIFKEKDLLEVVSKINVLAQAWDLSLTSQNNESILMLARIWLNKDYTSLNNKLEKVIQYPEYQEVILAAHSNRGNSQILVSQNTTSSSIIPYNNQRFFSSNKQKVDIEQFVEVLQGVEAKADLSEYLVENRSLSQ